MTVAMLAAHGVVGYSLEDVHLQLLLDLFAGVGAVAIWPILLPLSMSLNSQYFAALLRRGANSVADSPSNASHVLREDNSVWLRMCGQHCPYRVKVVVFVFSLGTVDGKMSRRR